MKILRTCTSGKIEKMTEEHKSTGSARELLQIAVPLALSTGTLSIMHVTDRVFLSKYDQDALAASLPAGMLSWTLLSFAFGTVGYINTFVAQYYGAGRRERVGASVWQGVYFSLFAALCFIPFLIYAKYIFAMLGYQGNVLQLETDYFQILGIGAAPSLLSSTFGCIYSGRGKTVAVLYVNLIAMVLNFFLDYGLIFGHFGLPRMGIEGAALATITGSVVSVLCWILLLFYDPEVREFGLATQWRFDTHLFGRIMKFGSPHGLMMFLEASLFNIFLAMIDRIGTIQLAATNLVFSLNTLAFIPMIGLQTSVMILVGQRIGEGRPEIAARTTRTAVILCSLYMAVWAVLYLGFPHTVVGLFGNDDAASRATRDISVILLRFVAAYTIFDGLQIIYGGAIRGAGDTRFSLFLYVLSEIFVMVVPTWIGIRYFGLGLFWAWTCMTAWVVVLAIGFFLRFKQGRWRSMRVIEHSVVDPESLAEISIPVTEPQPEVKV